MKVLPVEPALAKVTVAMASATLADDCPGESQSPPPPAPADPVETKQPTAPVWSKGASIKSEVAPDKAKSKSNRNWLLRFLG